MRCATEMSDGRLKAVLEAGDFIVAPGVFEMFSAKIADGMGFKALYMTGYGISASPPSTTGLRSLLS